MKAELGINPTSLERAVKAKLRSRFAGKMDDRGYVLQPEENLVPGVKMAMFEEDLRAGRGNELQAKLTFIFSPSSKPKCSHLSKHGLPEP